MDKEPEYKTIDRIPIIGFGTFASRNMDLGTRARDNETLEDNLDKFVLKHMAWFGVMLASPIVYEVSSHLISQYLAHNVSKFVDIMTSASPLG